MIWNIVCTLALGGVAGLIARALVPGDDELGVGHTILLGVAGSLVGGFLGYLIFRNDAEAGVFQTSGLVGSILGSVLVLLAYRYWRTSTSHAPPRS